MDDILKVIIDKFCQITISILGAMWAAVEITTISYMIPCSLAIIIDIISAVYLSKRINRKNPLLSDGKFKSEYKFKVLITFIIIFIAFIIGHYVDINVFKDGDSGKNTVFIAFLFYEFWSVVENWSSENDNKIARACQRIMVNKAERHIGVDISDIMLGDNETKNNNNIINSSNNINNNNEVDISRE